MQCPKCDVAMNAFTYMEVEIDRCPQCAGVWLDKGEMQTILDKGLGNIIDMPSSAEREKAIEMDAKSGHCRRCNKAMFNMPGADNIRFDWCQGCDAVFFDAGELAKLQAFDAD